MAYGQGTELSLHLLNLDEGTSRPLLHWPGVELHDPAYAPDGGSIAFVATTYQPASHGRNSTTVVNVLNLGDGQTRKVLDSPTYVGEVAYGPSGKFLYFVETDENFFGRHAPLGNAIVRVPVTGGAVEPFAHGEALGQNPRGLNILAGEETVIFTKSCFGLFLHNATTKQSTTLVPCLSHGFDIDNPGSLDSSGWLDSSCMSSDGRWLLYDTSSKWSDGFFQTTLQRFDMVNRTVEAQQWLSGGIVVGPCFEAGNQKVLFLRDEGWPDNLNHWTLWEQAVGQNDGHRIFPP